MFEKLVSLIPYNPGIIPQLSFYSRRMREEANIRRTGTIFIALAFVIQFIAVLSPPQSTVAASDNDIIRGGVSSIADARAKCISDSQGFQRILHYYGISCSAFDNAEIKTINSGTLNYYSMGRNTSPGQDTPVNIPGEGNKVYWRKLTTWGTQPWQTIHVDNQDGKNFYIIYDCGNLVSVGIPSPSPLRTPVMGPIVSNPVPTPTVTPTFTPTPVTPKPTPTPPTPTPPKPTPPKQPCLVKPSLAADDPNCKPCEYNGNLWLYDPACKPCDKSTNINDGAACINVRKTAANITAGIADANDTTAKAGDVITYTLYAENKGKSTIKDFTFTENLSDVLDYADVTDYHGGTIGPDKVVTWPKLNIKPDESRSVKVTVKVKDPIPNTPVSSSDPYHYDLIMTNVYGNTVNIKLPGSPTKQVEVAAATLPNTGPGTTLMIGAAIMITAGYFYSRASLLARESDIAIKETVSA